MEKFTATLRELDARLETFLSASYAELQDRYPVQITVQTTAGLEGVVAFTGYVMSTRNYSNCVLYGHFGRKKTEETHAYSEGNIAAFMQGNTSQLTVKRTISAIIVTAGRGRELIFNLR